MNCKGLHVVCKDIQVGHKGVSFCVVCLLLSDNMTVFPTPIMP